LEARKYLRIKTNFLGKKLERDEAMQPRVFAFVNHAHPAADPLEDAVMRWFEADKRKRAGGILPS
jgi:hypothetical protein